MMHMLKNVFQIVILAKLLFCESMKPLIAITTLRTMIYLPGLTDHEEKGVVYEV